MIRKHRLAQTTCAATIALGAFASAGAAQDASPSPTKPPERAASAAAKLGLVERPADRFKRSIEVHRLERRFASLRGQASELGARPRRDPSRSTASSTAELRERIERLERVVRRAKREAAEPEFGSVAGVSQATLDAIAACESGGDPSAVNPAGYYGKYQFDTGTWAAVGGSGNPAQASEAEQDYRAALLYSRAGASPWPVCGA